MANTFLDNKISSFIEDKFPEFVNYDHPVFVEFLRLYYQFLEAAKITLTAVQASDEILLENLLTDNFVLLEDGTKIIAEDSSYGAFVKGENVTGQTSGAVAEILAEDNTNTILYVAQNRFLQVGEVIVGSTSNARGTISKYQGNPVQNIQQLLEYANVDKTLEDFLDQFRNTYLTAIPNTLASGVSKRKLIKSVRDLYRAKGTKRGHEIFFRLMFGETPEIFYPTDNLLKVSAGTWTTDTVIRIVATSNNPNNLVGQTITQTIDPAINASASTAVIEGVVQFQEGETTVYQLILNEESIDGIFISGGEITGVDNTNADVAIAGTIQSMITGATVATGGSLYTIGDSVTITSATGKQALVDIVDVGSGEVNEVVIDNPGSGYAIGQELYFDSTGTEGAGVSGKIVNIGGAIAPEAGMLGEGMLLSDHIIYEDATEENDAYTGAQIQLEEDTFVDINASNTTEFSEIVNVLMFGRGSGYEKVPTVVVTSAKLYWNSGALTTSGTFQLGEIVTSSGGGGYTGIVSGLGLGYMTIASATGTFYSSEVITGSTTGAIATLTSVTTHGTGATLMAYSSSGIGAVKGVEVSKFGTGFTSTPTLTLPIKFLITRNINVGSPPDISLTTSFSVGDTIEGQTSGAEGQVTEWDNARQVLTVKITSGTFTIGEVLQRGSTTNYAIITKTSQGTLAATIGTKGTTAGAYDNDKGKISESLMKIQDSYYYQDFSYVVRVGSAIADWRGEVKKAVHPAGFAVFGEVSLVNRVSVQLTSPVELLGVPVSTVTPELASLVEAALTTIIGRRLGTDTDGTTLLANSNAGHKLGLVSNIDSITRSSTTVTVSTNEPHGVEVGEQVQITGVTTVGYNGTFDVTAVSGRTFTYTISATPATPGVVSVFGKVTQPSPFDNSTRDITLRSTYEYSFNPFAGGATTAITSFASFSRNRFGLGSPTTTAFKYMWSVGGTTATGVERIASPHTYVYPNMTRRKIPEAGTDNVDAGTAGVYDSTYNYTTIQIGTHEVDSHMLLGQFGELTIADIMDLNSAKIWNVPPPSYIRLITS